MHFKARLSLSLVALLAAMTLSPTLALANGNNALGQSYNEFVPGGGIVTAAAGTAGRPTLGARTSVDLVVSGIPAGATVH